MRTAKSRHTSAVVSFDPSSTTTTSYRYFEMLWAAKLSKVADSIAARLNVGITTLINGRLDPLLRRGGVLRLDDLAIPPGLARSCTLVGILLSLFKRVTCVDDI